MNNLQKGSRFDKCFSRFVLSDCFNKSKRSATFIQIPQLSDLQLEEEFVRFSWSTMHHIIDTQAFHAVCTSKFIELNSIIEFIFRL